MNGVYLKVYFPLCCATSKRELLPVLIVFFVLHRVLESKTSRGSGTCTTSRIRLNHLPAALKMSPSALRSVLTSSTPFCFLVPSALPNKSQLNVKEMHKIVSFAERGLLRIHPRRCTLLSLRCIRTAPAHLCPFPHLYERGLPVYVPNRLKRRKESTARYSTPQPTGRPFRRIIHQ